jgi:hypothetical protein
MLVILRYGTAEGIVLTLQLPFDSMAKKTVCPKKTWTFMVFLIGLLLACEAPVRENRRLLV